MFSNLYPLSNTTFINLGRAKFLCDLISGAPIDICAHIFHIIGKTSARSATRTILPFCNLVMKIVLSKGVSPSSDERVMPRSRPISQFSLQASQSHSSKKPKTEPSIQASPSAPTTVTPAQSTGTPSVPHGFQMPKQSYFIETVLHRISDLERLLNSFHSQTQMRLRTIELQLDNIQQKLEDSL